MMHLELTEEEHFTLSHILENYLSDLRMEIVDTDSSEFKDMLRERKEHVTHVLEKLQQTAPATQPEAQP